MDQGTRCKELAFPIRSSSHGSVLLGEDQHETDRLAAESMHTRAFQDCSPMPLRIIWPQQKAASLFDLGGKPVLRQPLLTQQMRSRSADPIEEREVTSPVMWFFLRQSE